jgi:hypothetical protein
MVPEPESPLLLGLADVREGLGRGRVVVRVGIGFTESESSVELGRTGGSIWTASVGRVACRAVNKW